MLIGKQNHRDLCLGFGIHHLCLGMLIEEAKKCVCVYIYIYIIYVCFQK